jgi:hypothetical protein
VTYDALGETRNVTTEATSSHARGSLERPMTREDLRRKFELLVLPKMPRAHADRLWELTLALEGEEDLTRWLRATWDWRLGA